ncbi:AAA family ATPase [Cetobacterium sp. SF1]|uniref:AAA family ATPase n=1 Tax=Cetobacterium sp. SF1 TaxID=3417654 RepID=UPI003CEF534F
MKPIKLEISGLQSFQEKQIIDFEKLTEYGLFGIFGETGSGKSTILDAIILALYNQIPRTNDSNDKIESSLNDSSDKLQVKFEFSLGDNIFEVFREYKKNKKGDIKPSNPIFKKNDEIIASKVRDVDIELKKELGISAKDFMRSVVLPQGKFSDFLKLKGLEKMEMLENIFELEKYGKDLQEKVTKEREFWKDKAKKLEYLKISKGSISKEEYKNLLNEKNNLNITLDKIKIDKENNFEKFLHLKSLKELYNQLKIYEEELLKLTANKNNIIQMENIIIKNKNSLSLKPHIEELENLNFNISNKKLIFNNLIGKEKKIDNKIKEKNNEIASLYENLENYKNNLLNLNFDSTKLRTLDKIISLYNLIEEKKQRISQQENDLNYFYNEIAKINNFIENILEEKENILNNLKNIQIPDEDILKKINNNIILKNNIILNIEKEIKNKISIEQELENENIALEMLNNKFLELTDKIGDLENKKLENLAYELSLNLKPNTPCPLCGSLDHPSIIKHIDSDFDIKELENLKISYNSLLQNKLKKENNITILKEKFLQCENFLKLNDYNILKFELESLKNDFSQNNLNINNLKTNKTLLENKLNEIDKLHKDKNNDLNSLRLKINSMEDFIKIYSIELKELHEKYNLLIKSFENTDINNLIKEKNILEENEIIYNNLKSNIEILTQEKQTFEDYLNNLKSSLKEIQININFEKNNLLSLEIEFENKNNFIIKELKNFNFNSIEESKEFYFDEKYISDLKNKIETYTKSLDKTLSLIEHIKSKINNENFDEETFNIISLKVEEFNLLYENKIKEYNSLEKRIFEAESLLEELELINSQEIETLKKLDTAEELFKKISGRKFVKFLAIKKLESIVFSASDRLEKITNGRYTLTIDDNCDFYIIDAFNNGFQRKASTLSGGETFIVSLSLALALSNQLQLKGNVQLEFFFLDEGFGTLDEGLLDKVIEALENIQKNEKLKVGIITHVNELKNKIIRKIEVSSPIPGEHGTILKLK